MSSYLIVYARIHNADRFQDYVDVVGPMITRYNGKIVARSGQPTVLEGDWPWMTVGVIEFPSDEDIRAFWFSDEYEEAKKLREGGVADFQVVMVGAA